MLLLRKMTFGSAPLRTSINASMKVIGFLAIARYALLIGGLSSAYSAINATSFNIFILSAIYLLLAYGMHWVVRPYVGYSADCVPLKRESDFVPLNLSLVPRGDMELSEQDYQELKAILSDEAKNKAKALFASKGKLSVLDAANLLFFTMQHQLISTTYKL